MLLFTEMYTKKKKKSFRGNKVDLKKVWLIIKVVFHQGGLL